MLALLLAPVAVRALAPLFNVPGTTTVTVNAPALFASTLVGTVVAAAPLSASTICSPGAKPEPFTISLLPGAIVVVEVERRGVRTSTSIGTEATVLPPTCAAREYVPTGVFAGRVIPVGTSTPEAFVPNVTRGIVC